jgi:hypothetical protein
MGSDETLAFQLIQKNTEGSNGNVQKITDREKFE